MAARTSSFRIDDLISAPKHTHALCGGDETQFKPLLPALSQPQAGPSSCTMAMAMSGDTVQRVAQLLAFASQQQSHVLDAAATAPPTPTLPLLFAAQPPSADAFHQYATAHFSPMSQPQPQPQPHPASLLANEAVANQVSPIPWYIYQQMALRQAFENGVCIPGMSSAFHDSAASYFFAAHQHSRKPKRIRTAFSPSQLLRLEAAFDKNPYVVGQERKELAASLNLSETQVKVWFQNRRTKKKRMKSDDSASQNGDSEQDDNENENGAGSRPQSSLSFSSKDSRSCKSPATSPAQS